MSISCGHSPTRGRTSSPHLDAAGAGALAATVRGGGGAATGVGCDVTVDQDRSALVALAEALGGVEVLVNNAGGWGDGPRQYPDAAPQDWDHVLDLNLRAPMRLLQLCLAGMRGRGRGAVVNIASSAGVETTAYGSPPYAVAKAGLVRLTTALAGLAEDGIRVSCVVPGWIGLPRAHSERAALSQLEQDPRPALVPPELIVAEVLQLARDNAAAGTVVELLDGTDRHLSVG